MPRKISGAFVFVTLQIRLGFHMYSEYYQARSLKEKTWFVMGCLRNEDNLVFFRTIDKDSSTFECFVSKECEERFLDIMKHLCSKGYVFDLQKKENRLQVETVSGENKYINNSRKVN